MREYIIEELIHFVVCYVLPALLALCLIAIIYDVIQWPIYKKEHHCKETEKIQETMYMQAMVGANNSITLIPMFTTKHEYKCDNNEIVWR